MYILGYLRINKTRLDVDRDKPWNSDSDYLILVIFSETLDYLVPIIHGDKGEWLVSMENLSVISVKRHFPVNKAFINTSKQSIRVSSMLVISVTTRLHNKVV